MHVIDIFKVKPTRSMLKSIILPLNLAMDAVKHQVACRTREFLSLDTPTTDTEVSLVRGNKEVTPGRIKNESKHRSDEILRFAFLGKRERERERQTRIP